MASPDAEPVYVATDLLEALLDLAAGREPEPVTVPLAVTPAAELDDAGGAEGAVFTHFYLPDAGRSVTAVFGVDLGTPAGTTPGIFLGHPDGRRELTKRDDLREVVLVAVPPWELGDVAAFDRGGRRRALRTVDVAVPEETPP